MLKMQKNVCKFKISQLVIDNWYAILLTWIFVNFFGQSFDTSDTVIDEQNTVFSESAKT